MCPIRICCCPSRGLLYWFAGGSPAYFVSDLIDHVDLSAITQGSYDDEETGLIRRIKPVMLTKVLVYGAVLRRRLLVAPDPALLSRRQHPIPVAAAGKRAGLSH